MIEMVDGSSSDEQLADNPDKLVKVEVRRPKMYS